MRKYAILVAGGSGTRMKSEVPKQFLLLKGKPVLAYALAAFQRIDELAILLVLPEAQIGTWETLVEKNNITTPHQIVAGGETRFHSVKKGLDRITDRNSLVAVHDGVRPLISVELIACCFKEAATWGSAVAAVPLKDSIRKTFSDQDTTPLNREDYRLVQTPQTFRTDWMKKAFEAPFQASFTDCASVVEHAGFPIHLTDGDYRNIKITTPEDLLIAEAFLSTT